MAGLFFTVAVGVLSFIALLIAVLFISFVSYVAYVRRKYAHLPGPKPDSFLMGHLPTIRKMYAKGKYSHYLFCEWAKEYGPLYKIFVFHKCLIVPTSQGLIKEFLTKSKYPKSTTYDRLSHVCGARFLGRGLVTNTDHENWSKRRATVDPAFHKKYLRNLMGQFNLAADKWIEQLYILADGKSTFSMWDILSRVTLDAIGQVAFDVDLKATADKDSPFPTAITKILEGYSIQMKDPILKYRWSKKAFVQKVQQSVHFLRSRCKVIIEDRLEKMNRGEDVPEDILTYIIRTLVSLPDLTIEDLLDDFVTMFLAGQETTANALSFMFNEIGRRPEILAKVKEEVDSVVGDKEVISYEDTTKLEYVSQVLKETLRLYPPAPGTSRDTPEEVTVEGFRLPKGTCLIMSFFVMHRLPQYYDSPDEFMPERWGPDKEKPQFAYMPFSLGQRSCAGQQFALIEAKTLICKFFQKFHYELDADQSFDVQETTTLRPKGGCKMNVYLN